MKRKIGLTATPMPKNWIRALYIGWKRKLRKVNQDLLIALVAIVILILQMFIIVTAVNAQDKPKGLQIGDKVPDVTITNIINHPTGTAKISDFKGKLLILDFWGTYCGSCIESLTKTTGLNEKFKDRALILPVTHEKAERVRVFLGTNKRLNGMKLTSVTEDQQLKSLFPHQTVPHLVWISPEGRVLSVTNAEYLKEENINAVLAGKPINWLQRSNRTFDYTKPIARFSKPGNAFYSAVTGHIPGADTKAGFLRIDSAAKRYYAINHDILHLYALAYGRGDLVFAPNRRILHVKDSGRYQYQKSLGYHDVWKAKNHHSYETVVPAGMKQAEIRQSMQQDLDRFLSLSTAVETRKVQCLVLKLDDANKPNSRTSKREVNLNAPDRTPFIHNAPLSVLVQALSQLSDLPPVIDETGFTKPVDIDFEQPLSGLPALKKMLLRHGLQLIPEERELEMFVLREKGLQQNKYSVSHPQH